MIGKEKFCAPGLLLAVVLAGACFMPLAVDAQDAAARGCATAPRSPLVVNVQDKGAKGDGRSDDTDAIQAAIDEVGGTGGTVLVPGGTYMVDVVDKKRRLALRSDMTLKLAKDAILKAIPNDSRKYSVLSISDVSNVAVVGGTIEGDRAEHQGKAGEAGMGIRIARGAEDITISGVTSRKMWGDGFYVEGAKNTKFCAVSADNNRRQGLSIVEADGVLVTDSVFSNTHGTRPSAGIDLEPDQPSQKIVNIRIQNSKFLNNAGPGIEIAGKRGAVAKVELAKNVFKGNRPILIENSPAVLASAICDNRQITSEAAPSQGLNAFADAIDIVVHQNDCQDGSDMRFEVNRQTRKKK
ncbi:MAG TPA: glycosyl hydrolase family 28-related protein [Methyloceanibacter sp.]|nr:glycosyl hydrolase family 28-related protein [Methyloceanibacter sp.]